MSDLRSTTPLSSVWSLRSLDYEENVEAEAQQSIERFLAYVDGVLHLGSDLSAGMSRTRGNSLSPHHDHPTCHNSGLDDDGLDDDGLDDDGLDNDHHGHSRIVATASRSSLSGDCGGGLGRRIRADELARKPNRYLTMAGEVATSYLDECEEWSLCFPHLRLSGVRLERNDEEWVAGSAVHERTGSVSNASVFAAGVSSQRSSPFTPETDVSLARWSSPNKQLCETQHVLSGDDNASLRVCGQQFTERQDNCDSAAIGADTDDDEMLACDGTYVEMFAQDVAPPGSSNSSVVHVPGVTNATLVKHARRRERLGFPPVSPQRLFTHEGANIVLDALWERVIRAVPPLVDVCVHMGTTVPQFGRLSPAPKTPRALSFHNVDAASTTQSLSSITSVSTDIASLSPSRASDVHQQPQQGQKQQRQQEQHEQRQGQQQQGQQKHNESPEQKKCTIVESPVSFSSSQKDTPRRRDVCGDGAHTPSASFGTSDSHTPAAPLVSTRVLSHSVHTRSSPMLISLVHDTNNVPRHDRRVADQAVNSKFAHHRKRPQGSLDARRVSVRTRVTHRPTLHAADVATAQRRKRYPSKPWGHARPQTSVTHRGRQLGKHGTSYGSPHRQQQQQQQQQQQHLLPLGGAIANLSLGDHMVIKSARLIRRPPSSARLSRDESNHFAEKRGNGIDSGKGAADRKRGLARLHSGDQTELRVHRQPFASVASGNPSANVAADDVIAGGAALRRNMQGYTLEREMKRAPFALRYMGPQAHSYASAVKDGARVCEQSTVKRRGPRGTFTLRSGANGRSIRQNRRQSHSQSHSRVHIHHRPASQPNDIANDVANQHGSRRKHFNSLQHGRSELMVGVMMIRSVSVSACARPSDLTKAFAPSESASPRSAMDARPNTAMLLHRPNTPIRSALGPASDSMRSRSNSRRGLSRGPQSSSLKRLPSNHPPRWSAAMTHSHFGVSGVSMATSNAVARASAHSASVSHVSHASQRSNLRRSVDVRPGHNVSQRNERVVRRARSQDDTSVHSLLQRPSHIDTHAELQTLSPATNVAPTTSPSAPPPPSQPPPPLSIQPPSSIAATGVINLGTIQDGTREHRVRAHLPSIQGQRLPYSHTKDPQHKRDGSRIHRHRQSSQKNLYQHQHPHRTSYGLKHELGWSDHGRRSSLVWGVPPAVHEHLAPADAVAVAAAAVVDVHAGRRHPSHKPLPHLPRNHGIGQSRKRHSASLPRSAGPFGRRPNRFLPANRRHASVSTVTFSTQSPSPPLHANAQPPLKSSSYPVISTLVSRNGPMASSVSQGQTDSPYDSLPSLVFH